MKTRLYRIVVLVVFLVFAFANVHPALAQAPNPPEGPANQTNLQRKDYCNRLGRDYDPERCLSLFEWAGEALNGLFVTVLASILKFFVGVQWFLMAVFTALANFVVSGTLFDSLYTVVVTAIESVVPAVLRESVLSPDGLFILLYSFGALLMVIPFVTVEGLPNAKDSLKWGVLLVVFFTVSIASGAGSGKPIGFYILDQVDSFRRGISRIALGESANGPIGRLSVGVFMNETPITGDIQTVNRYISLPPAYVQKHFPAAESEEVTVQFVVGTNTFLEREESRERRRDALSGVFADSIGALFVALSLFYIFLGLSALNILPLIFMILFFAALPTIFFGAGRKLLMALVNAYFTTIVLSLMFGVFLRLMTGFNLATAAMGGANELGTRSTARTILNIFFNGIFFGVIYGLFSVVFGMLKTQVVNLPKNLAASFAAIPYSYVEKTSGKVLNAGSFFSSDENPFARRERNPYTGFYKNLSQYGEKIKTKGYASYARIYTSAVNLASGVSPEKSNHGVAPSANAFEQTARENKSSEKIA